MAENPEEFRPDPALEKKNSESPIFICTQCGECCHIREKKDITEEEEQGYRNYMFKHYGIIYLAKLSEITINVFPEEKEILDKIASEKGIRINIRPKRAIYDMAGNQLIILDYFIDHDICPFFDRKNKLCGVYEHRPMICQSYPLISTKSFGKCKYKKLSINAYGSEKDAILALEDKVNRQKVAIKKMIDDKHIKIPEKLTDAELKEILGTARVVELRV
jgi:Fe-S-cluster containining protein